MELCFESMAALAELRAESNFKAKLEDLIMQWLPQVVRKSSISRLVRMSFLVGK